MQVFVNSALENDIYNANIDSQLKK
jgi:hypothetical protein